MGAKAGLALYSKTRSVAYGCDMADKFERFVAAYLRLNGYFTVPNFIVHASDDPTRVSGGLVGNYTEVDTIGLRMPYSREVSGAKHIVNHPLLVDGCTR